MKKLWVLAGIGSGLGIGLFVVAGAGRAYAEGVKPISGPIDLTVYKDDFALIHEKRSVSLTEGSNQVRLDHVSKQLDPNTVTFDPEHGSEVVATTYDLGVGATAGLIQRLQGKEVELIWASTDGHEGDRLKGILEPAPDGFLIRSGDKVYLNPAGTLVAPADSDVDMMPGLSVQLASKAAGSQALGMTYLTRGMSWSADYVAHLDPETSTMRLECWASVTNGTGIPYKDASITFVAGSPNRGVRMRAKAEIAGLAEDTSYGGRPDAPATLAAPAMAPSAVGELYEYPATAPATIGIDQMSRVRMFQAESIPVRFDYNVHLNGMSPWTQPGTQDRFGAQLAVKFENKKDGGLGLPLPAGGVRVFENDGKKDRYTGADTMSDVPKDTPVNLSLTKVFDVYAQPTLVKSQKIDKHTVRQTLRIKAHNSKTKEITLRVVNNMYGTPWKAFSGEKPEKLNANEVQWNIVIPANSDKTIETTFDIKY